jgi:hypothetical protein
MLALNGFNQELAAFGKRDLTWLKSILSAVTDRRYR